MVYLLIDKENNEVLYVFKHKDRAIDKMNELKDWADVFISEIKIEDEI